MSLLLGIDVGTSSAKAVLLTTSGQVVGRGRSSYPVHRPRAGWSEQAPEAWWGGVVEAVQMAGQGCANASHQVAAIGLSGQMHGTVLLDRRGTPLAPAVIWPDTRSGAQVREIEDIVGRERLLGLTGSVPATGFQAATVRWVQQNEPCLWADTHLVLLPKDYVRYRMVDEVHTDPSDGSGTLFLDIRSRAWCRPVLEALNVDRTRLPPITDSTAIAGELTPNAASSLGLTPGTPVVVGAADTAAGALGAGVISMGGLLLTLSTGGQLVQPVASPIVDPSGRIHTFCTATAPKVKLPAWYHLGAILSAGSALAWLRDNVFGLSGNAAIDDMSAWAGTSPAGARGLLFLPYLLGERTPHMDPTASGLLMGLTADHGRADLVRAVMEGVALACFDAYHVLMELGARPRTISLSGGGGRSRVWQQIVADVFGLPLRPLAGSDHSATGAAMLAGSGLGLLDILGAGGAWAHYGSEVVPRPHAQAVYGELHALFQEEYVKHRKAFARLRAMGRRERGGVPRAATLTALDGPNTGRQNLTEDYT